MCRRPRSRRSSTFFLIDRAGRDADPRLRRIAKSRAQEAFEAGPLLRAAAHCARRHRRSTDRGDARRERARPVRRRPRPRRHRRAAAPGGSGRRRSRKSSITTIRSSGRRPHASSGVCAPPKPSTSCWRRSRTPASLVRQFSVEALGVIGADRAAKPLLSLLAEGRGAIPAQALLALARMGHAPSRTEFPESPERSRSPDAPRRGGGPRPCWRTKSRWKRCRAFRRAIARTTCGSPRRLPSIGSESRRRTCSLPISSCGMSARRRAITFWRLAGPRSRAFARRLEVAKDDRHRADLVHLIGFVGTRDEISWLETFLADRDERVRRAAADAIARLKR